VSYVSAHLRAAGGDERQGWELSLRRSYHDQVLRWVSADNSSQMPSFYDGMLRGRWKPSANHLLVGGVLVAGDGLSIPSPEASALRHDLIQTGDDTPGGLDTSSDRLALDNKLTVGSLSWRAVLGPRAYLETVVGYVPQRLLFTLKGDNDESVDIESRTLALRQDLAWQRQAHAALVRGLRGPHRRTGVGACRVPRSAAEQRRPTSRIKRRHTLISARRALRMCMARRLVAGARRGAAGLRPALAMGWRVRPRSPRWRPSCGRARAERARTGCRTRCAATTDAADAPGAPSGPNAPASDARRDASRQHAARRVSAYEALAPRTKRSRRTGQRRQRSLARCRILAGVRAAPDAALRAQYVWSQTQQRDPQAWRRLWHEDAGTGESVWGPVQEEPYWYRPLQDQRHRFALDGRLRHRAWEFGVHLQLASGLPYTPVVDVARDADGNAYGIVGRKGSAELPAYQRLDLRVLRHFDGKSVDWRVFAEVLNATSAANVYMQRWNRAYTQQNTVTMLPLLPTVGVEASF
jgi:hypothetical protein